MCRCSGDVVSSRLVSEKDWLEASLGDECLWCMIVADVIDTSEEGPSWRG